MAVHIRKTYRGVNPEMLYEETRDLVRKQGLIVDEGKIQTYALPSGSTQSRVVLVFRTQGEQKEAQKECGSAHIVGLSAGDTKMILDIDENLLPQAKVSALQENLDFILGSYEVKL